MQHFTAENGLPQNSVKSIAVDAKGFIWLATEDGLTRFDGRKFEVFQNNNTGAHSKRVISILPGQRNSQQRNRLNISYALFASDETTIISNGRTAPVSNDMELRNRKLKAFRAGKKDIYYINGLPERWPRAMSPEIPSLITDTGTDGNFFLCDRSAVSCYRRWIKEYELHNDAPERLNYFTLGGRLYYFDGKKTFVQIFNNQRLTFQAKGDILQNKSFAGQKSQIRIYWNNNTDQAFFYLDGQLFALVQEKDGSLSTHLLTNGIDLITESIDVVYYDPDNKKVFMGSSTNGLFVISLPQFETIKVSGPDRPNIFYAQVPYDDNSVLTPTGIIAGRNDRSGEKIDRILPEVKSLHNDDRRFIFKDVQANIWIKSGNSLTRLDQKNQVIGKWIFRNGVKAIYQKNNSEFWIGVYAQGIFKIDVRRPTSEPLFIGGEPAKHITCMSSKSSDELWVGTLKGLYIVNTRNGQTSLVSETSGLNIKSVQPYDKSRSWVTALDKGLMLVNSDKQIVAFPMDKRGFLASAHYTFNDGSGFLWIPTNRGLFQIKISDLLWYAEHKVNSKLFYAYHGMNEGFNTNEFNGGCNSCGLKLGSGYVSLPSLDGLVWFKPENITANEPKGEFILDGVQADGKTIESSGDTIRLPLKSENVKVQFSTAYFGNPGNLQISYSLTKEGDQANATKWQDIDDANDDIVVRYLSLPSGTYQLTVRKPGGFGPNNFICKKLIIIVPETWYENSWVHLLSALLCLSAGFVILKLRFKRIEMRNQLLEMQVSARTDELRQTLLTLETSQNDLLHQFHLHSRLLTSMAHDLRSPLSAASLVISEVGRLISQQQYERAVLLNRQVEDGVGLIKQSIDELLTYVKVQVYSKEVKIENVAISSLIDKSFNFYAKTSRINPNSFKNNVPKNVTARTNPQLLNIIIRNLTDNANKFTESGTISANWAHEAGGASLAIRDTGTGLPANLVNWFSQTGSVGTLENFSGLGLIIVKELAPFAMIRLNIHSGEGGTAITLNFSDTEPDDVVIP